MYIWHVTGSPNRANQMSYNSYCSTQWLHNVHVHVTPTWGHLSVIFHCWAFLLTDLSSVFIAILTGRIGEKLQCFYVLILHTFGCNFFLRTMSRHPSTQPHFTLADNFKIETREKIWRFNLSEVIFKLKEVSRTLHVRSKNCMWE